MKDCEHYYQLQHTSYEYPSGISGTASVGEYAYLMCTKCWKVIKKEVESIKE